MPFHLPKFLRNMRKSKDKPASKSKDKPVSESKNYMTTHMADEAERQASRKRPIRIDPQTNLPEDVNDHSADDKMNFFTYWHYKITKYTPNNVGGMDGKRETNNFSQLYGRQMDSYERRQSEKKAAKAVKKNAKEEQERREQGLPDPGPKRKSKVSDMFSKKTYSDEPKTETGFYGPTDKKVDLQ